MNDPPLDETDKSRFCGKPGRSGPPKGNRNALRHGLRGGQLPRDARYVELRLNKFRQRLEDEVMALRGAVGLTDACTIQTCLRWERYAALAQHWLRKAGAELTPTQKLMFSEKIAQGSSNRDKHLALLKLNETAPAPWILTPLVVEDSA